MFFAVQATPLAENGRIAKTINHTPTVTPKTLLLNQPHGHVFAQGDLHTFLLVISYSFNKLIT
jgi:hypothetical protein